MIKDKRYSNVIIYTVKPQIKIPNLEEKNYSKKKTILINKHVFVARKLCYSTPIVTTNKAKEKINIIQ